MKRPLLLTLLFCLLVTLSTRAQSLIASSTSPLSLGTTVYGTATGSRSFTVSGTGMQAGILVTPPAGFEVSLDNATFSGTVTVGTAGNISPTTVYVRLPGTANAATYAGNISLSSQGATTVNSPAVSGKVDPFKMELSVFLTKSYGESYPSGTYTYQQMDDEWTKKMKNGNKFNSIDITFNVGNGALDKAGTYYGATSIKNFTGRDGYLPGNYDLTYTTNNVYVLAADLIITANSVTKPYGTQLANVTGSAAFTTQGLQNGETITTVDIVYGAGAAAADAAGIYTGSVVARNARGGTINPANYNIQYINGTLTIPPPEIATNGPAAINTIMACVGTASVSPLVQQFTVSGKTLRGDVTVSAPANFELARAAGGPYSTSLIITAAAANAAPVTVYVRSAATAPVGNIKGDVSLASTGAVTKMIAVSGTINALPTYTAPGPQTYNNGDNTTVLKMTGTGNFYSWTNDNPAIGLAANGTGDIPSFKAVNTTAAPIKATITVTPASIPLLKVNNSWSHTISTVDLDNNRTLNTFTVPGDASSIALSPDQTRLYVTNSTSDHFYAYNTADNSLISSIATAPTSKVVVHPNGKRVYLVNSALQNSHVDVINIETVPFTRITKLPVSGSPSFGVLNSDGSLLYVCSSLTSELTVINTVNNTVVATIYNGMPPDPNYLALSPDNSKLYVAGTWMAVMNTATNTVTKLSDIQGEGLVVSRDGNKLYTSRDQNRITAINVTTGQPINDVMIDRAIPWALSADGTQIFTTNIAPNQFDKGSVSAVSTTTNTVIRTLEVGALPFGLAVVNGTNCPGIPERFEITVNPTIELNNNGSPSAVSTEYGTNSASSSFTLGGTNISQPVTVKAPAGFSVSINNGPFATQSTFPATLLNNPVTVSIRLDATTNAGEYSGDIVFTSAGANTLTIPMPKSLVTRAPLKITATNVVKMYGQTLVTPVIKNSDYSITSGSLKNGNTITSVTINYGAGRNATDEPKTYTGAVTITDITGANGFDEKNYDISRPIIADLTVLPLTFTANGAPSALDTEYGTPSAASTFTLSGSNTPPATLNIKAPPGFSLSVNGMPYSGEFQVPGVWLANPITVSIRLDANTDAGDHNGDITISAPGIKTLLVPMPLSTVRPAPITFTVDPVIKTYGDALTTPATVSTGVIPTTGTLKNGNTITSLTLRYTNGYRATDNATIYNNAAEIIGVTGSNGFLESNYKITKVQANITVNKAKLTIKADNVSKVYGSVLTAGNTSAFTATGIRNQQQIDWVTRTYGDGATAGAAAKTYTGSITPRAATGSNFTPANYDITYTEGDIIVTPATITVTVADATRERGENNPVFTATYQGFVNNDDENVIRKKARISTTADRTSAEGTYPITATGAEADNYTFVYIPGQLTVTPRAIIILKIPNTFTPNGDGINDRWEIGNIFLYPKCTVNIFTRYGTPVFTSNNGYTTAWDGTYNGQYLNAGTYYYVIKPDNGDKPLSGSITLLR